MFAGTDGSAVGEEVVLHRRLLHLRESHESLGPRLRWLESNDGGVVGDGVWLHLRLLQRGEKLQGLGRPVVGNDGSTVRDEGGLHM